MTELFQPKGETARWRILYGLFQPRAIGDTITYQEMGDALGLDPDKDRHAIQMAVRRASIESERVDKRAVEASPNVGYRIVEPIEHVRLAARQQQKSGRALVSARSKVVNVDLNGLDPDVRQAFGVMARAFSMQMDFNRRMDIRQKRLEDAVDSVSTNQARSAEDVAQLRERLERMERRLAESEVQSDTE